MNYDLPVEISSENVIDIVFLFLAQLLYIKPIRLLNLAGSEILGVTVNNHKLPRTVEKNLSLGGGIMPNQSILNDEDTINQIYNGQINIGLPDYLRKSWVKCLRMMKTLKSYF